MRLYHLTDQKGYDAIRREGFRSLDPPHGPAWDSPDRGFAWFARSKEIARATCWRREWWVIIDVPDDTPEHVLPEGKPYSGNYRLPHDHVNQLALAFERAEPLA